MSTELVAIEKIEIRHGDKNADEIRMELVKYLRQFLDSASIESMTLHDLAISINGEMILYLVDKTGGKGLRGLDEDWQKDHKTVDSVNMILNDVDVTVVLSYEMIHYFSNDTFYGFNYWSDVLHGNASDAVTYHGLEYYDCESSISMLHFENGVLTDSPDYVSEKKVADIPAWFCYNFELDLEVDDEFSADQRTRIEKALDSIRDMSGIPLSILSVRYDCLALFLLLNFGCAALCSKKFVYPASRFRSACCKAMESTSLRNA